jgi:hypothetical protein
VRVRDEKFQPVDDAAVMVDIEPVVFEGTGGAAATSPAEITVVPGHAGMALKLTGDHPVQTAVGNFRRSQPFSVALWLEAPVRYDRAVVFHRSQAWTDAGSRGYELLVEEGHFQWSLIHFWPGDAASVRSVEPVPVGRWTHLVVTSDGSGAASGLKLFVDGRPAAVEIVRDSLTREITGGGGVTVQVSLRAAGVALPTPVAVDPALAAPTSALEALERYEGMRVSTGPLVTVAASVNGGGPPCSPRTNASGRTRSSRPRNANMNAVPWPPGPRPR